MREDKKVQFGKKSRAPRNGGFLIDKILNLRMEQSVSGGLQSVGKDGLYVCRPYFSALRSFEADEISKKCRIRHFFDPVKNYHGTARK